MDRRRWWRRTAWGGGIATVVGIVLFALFSDAGGSCTANVIVLSDGVIGPHGCAASSIAYHAGIGLMVLGAALLIGACVLAVAAKAESGVVSAGAPAGVPTAVPTGLPAEERVSAIAAPSPAPEPPEVRVTATAPEAPDVVEEVPESDEQDRGEEVIALPPGWYGNPSNRNGTVQWWDGHRLVDRPPPGSP